MKNLKIIHDLIISENVRDTFQYLNDVNNYKILRSELCESVGDDPTNASFGVRVYTVCIHDIFESLRTNNQNGAWERIEELYYNIVYGDADLFKKLSPITESYDEVLARHRSLALRQTLEPVIYQKNVPQFCGKKYFDPIVQREICTEIPLVFETKTNRLPLPTADEIKHLNAAFADIHYQWVYEKLKEEHGLKSAWENIYTHPYNY